MQSVTQNAAPPLAAYLKTPAWAALAGRAGAANDAPDADVVLGARARLARNVARYPFPNRASELDARRVASEIRRAALADTERLADLSPVAVGALSPRDRAELVDARRISPDLADGASAERYALLDETGALSVFINEEDHIRIQALAGGAALGVALASAHDADARLARRLTYARDADRWGYLTASLGNVGTGLRLSALVHLPALVFLGRARATLAAAHDLDISLRGAHGEHSDPSGDLYQISNAVTFGRTNEQIAGRVRAVVTYLVHAERDARAVVARDHADKAYQAARTAWVTIEQADRLSAPDALDLLSALRLAAACALASAPAPQTFALLVADLRTGAGLASPAYGSMEPTSVRDAIQRPAKIRSVLRDAYRTTGAP